MSSDVSSLAFRYDKILKELGDSKATLVAVSKYTSDENIIELYDLGHRDFGENRVKEFCERAERLEQRCPEIRWHFIGNLQRNKVTKLLSVEGLVAIHSVDRLSLLQKILIHQYDDDSRIDLYFQINTSGESQKAGMDGTMDIIACYEYFREKQNPHFKFAGLMTMAAIRTQSYEQDARESFRSLEAIRHQVVSLYPEIKKLKLNMGMSKDYKLAIEEGSHLIRVGSSLFNEPKGAAAKDNSHKERATGKTDSEDDDEFYRNVNAIPKKQE